MKTHKALQSLLQEAQDQRRCAYSRAKSEQSALRRHAQAGELVHTYHGAPSLFAEVEYWHGLTPPERTMHIAKALAMEHPDWVFGGLVAATAYGFDHPWCLHDGSVTVMVSGYGSRQCHRQLHRVYMADALRTATRDVATGLLLAPPATTVVDCAMRFEFRFALPIFDSAFAQGLTVEQVAGECTHKRIDCAQVFRLLRHVNPLSENGGESLARGTIIDDGFPDPRIQVVMVDPKTGAEYRVDFVWQLDDGRIAVGEYDGTRKYVDPAMTGNRAVQDMFAKERERDEGIRRAGADDIIHFNYYEVVERIPLRTKLLRAGIARHTPDQVVDLRAE